MIKELEEYFKNTPREQVLKDWEVTQDFKSLFLCDRCGCEIESPHLFGKQHYHIELISQLNFPEHDIETVKYQLCEDCYNVIDFLLTAEIMDYEK